jgi:putative ABC transport system permease protein
MSLFSFLGTLEIGFIFGLVAIGVYLTFRVLDFPDLTVDGSFTMGAAIAAALIVKKKSKSSNAIKKNKNKLRN